LSETSPTNLFPVRHYECDAYGHLNNVSYVHYLHEAILQLDAAGDAPGRPWQTARLDVEYLRPVRYGETVEVRLVAAGLQGAALRRAFEFRVYGSDEPAAQARIEATGQLAPQQAGSSAVNAVEIDALPPLPAPPPGVFTMRHCVSWQDLDLNRRVSDAALLGFTESCGMAVIAAHGWPAARMAAEGFAIILRRHRMVCISPVGPDDELEVATWVSDVKRVSATRHYTIARRRDGALLARVDTLGVWVNLATGRPIRIPDQCATDFAPNVATEVH
jgi:acyl-CoA thioester hydrolase